MSLLNMPVSLASCIAVNLKDTKQVVDQQLNYLSVGVRLKRFYLRGEKHLFFMHLLHENVLRRLKKHLSEVKRAQTVHAHRLSVF